MGGIEIINFPRAPGFGKYCSKGPGEGAAVVLGIVTFAAARNRASFPHRHPRRPINTVEKAQPTAREAGLFAVVAVARAVEPDEPRVIAALLDATARISHKEESRRISTQQAGRPAPRLS